MALIAVSCLHKPTSRAYAEALGAFGAECRFLESLYPGQPASSCLMEGIDGLLLGGEPGLRGQYGAITQGLKEALRLDMPLLAIGEGMQLLNLVFGGKLLDELPGHAIQNDGSEPEPSYHQIYVTPGSKLSAILGPGGFFRVNSFHRQGLREAQRSPQLLTSAYSVEDGVVEGLESPAHDWVIGVQFQPERAAEVPKAFTRLFAAFVERTEKG